MTHPSDDAFTSEGNSSRIGPYFTCLITHEKFPFDPADAESREQARCAQLKATRRAITKAMLLLRLATGVPKNLADSY
jgi:hypothetical protein